jgi:hypothetical protein
MMLSLRFKFHDVVDCLIELKIFESPVIIYRVFFFAVANQLLQIFGTCTNY